MDWALAGFSGYVAADELYDGPFCVLSIVDNRTFRRLIYEVLDHDPTSADIARILQRLKSALQARGLHLRGITTDASPLYPGPIIQVFGAVPHQICEFHVLAELTKAILKTLSRTRKGLRQRMPQLPRGRPYGKRAQRRARRKKLLQKRLKELFEHRHLFVQHHLTHRDRKLFLRVTRPWPELRRLREIMDEVYRLFDRRCRTSTALARLARLRQQVRRSPKLRRSLRKLLSPTVEKPLRFLDNPLLPATSNAVERGNRRHRKMQKTVYRVRTRTSITQRVALDMRRERQAEGRGATLCTMHRARSG